MDLNIFKNKIRKQDILIINGTEYNTSNLVGGVNYEQTVNSGTDIVLGSCTCATIEFELMNLNNLINNIAGKEITWKKRVEGYPDLQMGIFIAEKPTKINDTRIRVKAYDRMIKFDTIVDDWLRTVSYPITLKNFLLGLCSYVGVTLSNTTFLNDNYPIKFNFLGKNVKGREVLKWISEIAAKYAVINELGQLRLGWYNNIVYSVNNSNYYNIKVEDYQVKKIDKLQVRVEENDIGVIVGTGTNAYVIENNPLLYAATDAEIRPYVELIYNAIKDFSYMPFEMKVNDNPLIKAGNSFQITTRKGQVFNAVVMSRKMTNGSDVFSATGNIDRSINKSVNTSIKQLRGKTNVLERTVEHTITRLYDADTGDISQLTQTVNSFNSRVQTIEANMNFRYQQDTAPEDPEIGDVWLSTSNEVFIVNNLLMTVNEMTQIVDYYSNSINRTYRWTGTIWEVVEDGAITELRHNVSEIEQTVDQISLTVSSYDGRIGTLELTANSLTSRIQNAEGDISTVTQTADTLTSKVLAAEGNISTITQTTDSLVIKFDGIKSLDETIQGGVTTISKNGIVITTTNNKSKLEMLASSGYALYTDTGSGLEKKFYVDTNGKLQAKSLVIDGNSEFKGKIDVSTDITVGNRILLNPAEFGVAKGIYFTSDFNSTGISAFNNKLWIFGSAGIDLTTYNERITINRPGGLVRINGNTLEMNTTSVGYSLNSGEIDIRASNILYLGGGGNRKIEISSSNIDFKNSTVKNMKAPAVVNASAPSSYGIEFRISGSKLQYKLTYDSIWKDII